jgi:catechol 2,3-dioxygenase-like lactoylglutathione lyase family enzyme
MTDTNPPRPHHLNLAVDGDDITRTVAFYRDVMGLTPVELPRDQDAYAASLQSRPAQAVYGRPADLYREACEEQGHTSYVAVVLAGLVGASHVDVLDLLWGDTGPLHEGFEGEGREVVGAHGAQGTAVVSYGRTYRSHDPGFVGSSVSHAFSAPPFGHETGASAGVGILQ